MAQAVLASSAASRLEPLLLLAKGAREAACAKLIQDAISTPGLYVFGELLDMPNIQDLANSDQYKQYHSLLNIFTYGTVQDYRDNQAQLPSISPQQFNKLQHLTLATLSSQSRILKYDQLLSTLEITSLRELEDLVIDAIYQNVISGKLDQKKQCLTVEYSMGRDVRPEQTASVLHILEDWLRTSEDILSRTDMTIQSIKDSALARQTDDLNYTQALEEVKSKVVATATSGPARPRRGESDGSNHGLFRDDQGDGLRSYSKR
ncbi:hypothetical protein BSLG_005436 [Batrachochytrium salamandrivorans]|nr:hypothetical protein BSLG_005436 [Batrachochytrium salamandrivorans]